MLQQEELGTRRIELLLDMQMKKMLAEIGGMREELQQLRSEVSQLKRSGGYSAPPQAPPQQYAAAAMAAAPSTQAVAYEQHAQPQAAQPPEQRQERRPNDKPIDRNGIAPSQVSIEKIFYCGQR